MYFETLLSILFLLCLWCFQRQFCRPENFPPGPTWLPVVGNFLVIRKLMKQEKYHHKAYSFLAELYNSSIVGLKLGESLVAVVSGMALIQKVLTKEEFEGRPNNFFIRLRSMGTRKGVTCTDGVFWHDQRAFIVKHLRNLGYGKQNMENILHDEFNQLRNQLDTTMQNVRLSPLFAKAVLNTLWTLVAGSRLTTSNLYLDKMLPLMEKRNRSFDISGGLLNYFPWLRFFAPKSTGYKLILDINREMKSLFQEVIAEHEMSYDPLETRDVIDAFLHEMKSVEKKPNSAFYTEDQLIMICLDFFIAGSQTTSNTLDFAILCMILNQNIQRKVRDEIWSVIGKERLPSSTDRSKMPYVEAVINEVLRWCQVTPIAGPRRALRDTELGDFSIPKDTSILINLHSVHMNKEHWDDPETFRPDRFLNVDGTLKNDEFLIPFGLGRRRCLGEALARSFIFIFFTGIIQRYHIYSVAEEKPDVTPVPGITLSSQPYHVVLVPVETQ